MNKKKTNSKKLIKIIIILLMLVSVVFVGIKIIKAYVNSRGYKITNGGYITDLSNNFTPNKIDEGTCRVVTSEICSSDVFVPTNTSAEYNDFLANPPSCIALGKCPSCGTSINNCNIGTVSNTSTLYGVCGSPCVLSESYNTYIWYCNNGKASVSCVIDRCEINSSCGGSTCFIAGTLVKMADGTEKNIESIITGDMVLGSNGAINTVNKLWKLPHNGLLYAFNGGKKFVTDSHPFMTTSGWKSFSPEKTKYESPDLIVTYLRTGDILIKENGKQEKIENIQTIHRSGYVYNFRLNNTHEYYADGYLVHNPQQKQNP